MQVLRGQLVHVLHGTGPHLVEVPVNDDLYCLAEDGREDGDAKSTGECQGETVC